MSVINRSAATATSCPTSRSLTLRELQMRPNPRDGRVESEPACLLGDPRARILQIRACDADFLNEGFQNFPILIDLGEDLAREMPQFYGRIFLLPCLE